MAHAASGEQRTATRPGTRAKAPHRTSAPIEPASIEAASITGGAAPQRASRDAPSSTGGAATRRAVVAPLLAEHERVLWGVCYRMTGSAADADDLVQETFLRAMERPPVRAEEPMAPWLMRVAVNLGRDALRRRKRRKYVGPWLPAPIESDEVASFEIEGEGGTEGRYDLMESVSFAFLLALEVLTPNQRAVLLLRDVLDRSVRETADMLGMSEANVKVVHHRARAALAPYEASRVPGQGHAALSQGAAEALQKFAMALAAGDEAALTQVFAEDAIALADGGGEFLASKSVVRGAARIAKMYMGLNRKTRPVEKFTFRSLNGVIAIVAERHAHKREAPRMVMACDVDGEGRIVRMYNVVASEKLAHVEPIAE